MKYVFTGDIDREVISNPHFNGKEAHLLKCQIIRISFSTTIIPAGSWVVREDERKKNYFKFAILKIKCILAREIDPAEEENIKPLDF